MATVVGWKHRRSFWRQGKNTLVLDRAFEAGKSMLVWQSPRKVTDLDDELPEDAPKVSFRGLPPSTPLSECPTRPQTSDSKKKAPVHDYQKTEMQQQMTEASQSCKEESKASTKHDILKEDERCRKLWKSSDYWKLIAAMERGWWLRESFYGKGTREVGSHVEELVLVLNHAAMHWVHLMAPQGNDESARLAYACLSRALLLTEDSVDSDIFSSESFIDTDKRKRLHAISLNNLGCYFERRKRLVEAWKLLDNALRLEMEVQAVDDPAATHLNLCRVLSGLGRHDLALKHARCAIGTRLLPCVCIYHACGPNIQGWVASKTQQSTGDEESVYYSAALLCL